MAETEKEMVERLKKELKPKFNNPPKPVVFIRGDGARVESASNINIVKED